MTYDELQTFTKRVVLKYLPEIVRAEERKESYPQELTYIARGLNFPSCAIFVNILRDTYKIQISI